MKNKLKIISGKWKRRTISFDVSGGVRPTTSSARETLFNWLQSDIEGSVCLDLFAGSGSLGFEALSRGAKSVVLVDRSQLCVRHLRNNARIFKADYLSIVRKDALVYLGACELKFDIIFLDPPFFKDLLVPVISLLEQRQLINSGARVYIECEKDFQLPELSKYWEILRSYKAGNRGYFLLGFD